MAGIGMGPSKLKKVVPGQQEQQQIMQAQMQGAPKALSPEEIDSIISQAMAEEQATPSPSMAAPEISQPGLSQEEIDATIANSLGLQETQTPEVAQDESPGLLEQLSEAPDRFRASFAKTDFSVGEMLKKKYGQDGVRQVGGDFEIKKDGKWRKFDPDAVEVLNDVLDLARPIAEGAASLAGSVVGGAGGLMLGGPAGAAVGAKAGSATASAVADTAATKFGAALGVPEDPTVNNLVEAGKAAALDLAVPKILEGAGSVLSSLGKKIATTPAAKAASGYVKSSVRNTQEMLTSLKENLNIEKIPGYGIMLSPTQVDPASGVARGQEAILMGREDGQKFLQEFYDRQKVFIGDTVDAVLNQAGNVTGPKQNLKQGISSTLESMKKRDGELIELYRTVTKDVAGDIKWKPDNLVRDLENLNKTLQIERKGDQLRINLGGATDAKLTLGTFASAVGAGANPKEAEILFNIYQQMQQEVVNGKGLRFQQLQQRRDLLNNVIEQGIKQGSPITRYAVQLKKSVEKAQLGIMDAAVGNVAEYKQALSGYKDFAESRELLGKMLENDEVAQSSMAKFFFDGGRAGLDKFNMMKGVLNRENPQLVKDIIGQHIGDVMEKSGGDFGKALKGLAPNKEALEAMFEGVPGGAKTVQDLFTLADTMVKQGTKEGPAVAADNASIGLIKRMAMLVIGWQGAQVGSGADIIAKMSSNKEFRETLGTYLTEGNIDRIVKGMPMKEAGKFRTALRGMRQSAGAVASKVAEFEQNKIPQALRRSYREVMPKVWEKDFVKEGVFRPEGSEFESSAQGE